MARVLIGTDGSDLAGKAAMRAMGLIGVGHAVTVVRVVRPRVTGAIPAIGLAPAALDDELLEPSHQAMLLEAGQDTMALARQLGADVTSEVVQGDPGVGLRVPQADAPGFGEPPRPAPRPVPRSRRASRR